MLDRFIGPSARRILVLGLFLVASAARGQVVDGYRLTPIPGPKDDATKATPMIVKFNVQTKDGPVWKTVTIESLPKKAATETDLQAMQRKAETYVAEINKQLGADLARVVSEGEVRATETKAEKRARGKIVKDRPWVEIKGLATGNDSEGRPIATDVFVQDPTKQIGNGGSVRQGSGLKGGGGQKLSLGATMGNLAGQDLAALGFDPNGEASLVEFGVDGVFVASLHPAAGTSDLSILATLSSQLNDNGVRNTFDAAARSVTIDPLYDSEEYTIYWTSTDAGLPFSVTLTAVPVPEPGTWALMAMGLAALSLRSRRAGHTGAH